MPLREASLNDIDAMHTLRLAVKENVLITHSLVTRDHYLKYLFDDGKGWVYEIEGSIVGFGIVDLKGSCVWGLFVSPEHEGKGIGKLLQEKMLKWYFNHSHKTLSLTTAQGTRAEKFYTLTGWKHKGILSNGEIKFEMEFNDWPGQNNHPI